MLNDLFPALVSLAFIGVVFLVVYAVDLRRVQDHRAAVAAEKNQFTKRSAVPFMPRRGDTVSGPAQ